MIEETIIDDEDGGQDGEGIYDAVERINYSGGIFWGISFWE